MKMGEEGGQMAVELAVVMPIILLIMVIAIDGLVFASECARFDHIVPQQIIAHAVSPPKDEYEMSSRTAAIQSALEGYFTRRGSSIVVSCEDAGLPLASAAVYTCTFRFAPWPLPAADGPVALVHSYSLVVDPYTPGELL